MVLGTRLRGASRAVGDVARLADRLVLAASSRPIDRARASDDVYTWTAVKRLFTSSSSASRRGWGDEDGAVACLGFDHPPPTVPPRRVVVTGIGLATPLGVGTQLVWDRLLEGRSGIRELTPHDIPEGTHGYEQMPVRIGARVPRVGENNGGVTQMPEGGAFDSARWCEGDVDRAGASPKSKSSAPSSPPPAVGGGPRIAPFTGLALAASHEALADANWDPSTATEPQLARCGVSVGAGMGHVSDLTNAGALLHAGKLRRVSPFFVPRILCNMAAGHISMAHGFRGINHAVSTACATGAHAIGDAFRAIQRGDADLIVAGGTESCLDAVSIAGFARARALADPARFPEDLRADPESICRPFDSRRGGFVMGEGAGVLVLESFENAMRRGAVPYAEVRGYGQASDAHHITQPPGDGHGASLAMRHALADAGIEPTHVGYVNAHATGTVVGDAAEFAALRRVFGDHLTSGALSVSSTKGATGHLLGAAGAVEAAFAILALANRTVPPTLNLERLDPSFGDLGSADFTPLKAKRKEGIRAVLTNSFGFGGTNASLVLTAPPGRDVDRS